MSFRHEWCKGVNAYRFYYTDRWGNEFLIAEGVRDTPDPGDNGMWLTMNDCYPTVSNTYSTTFVFELNRVAVIMFQRLSCIRDTSQEIITTFHKGIDRDGIVKDLIDYCRETFEKDCNAFICVF
jgi:hypothetical protein